jgi:SAM-dependent methyltransferase
LTTRLRFYDELADWWPLFSPPEDYVEEAEDLWPRLQPRPGASRATLLELGSGGGSLASHLKPHFQLTLTDRSPGMLAVSRSVNPECEPWLQWFAEVGLSAQSSLDPWGRDIFLAVPRAGAGSVIVG